MSLSQNGQHQPVLPSGLIDQHRRVQELDRPYRRIPASRDRYTWLAAGGAYLIILAAVSLCFLLPRSPNQRTRRGRDTPSQYPAHVTEVSPA